MIEIPHGWTNLICHSSSPQYLNINLLNGRIAGGKGRKERRQPCYVSAAHPEEKQGSTRSKPQIVHHAPHKRHTDAFYELDLAKAQDTGLQFYQNFSYAVVHFGDVPAECIARGLGHEQTILYVRPCRSADFRASGGRLLHSDQKQKRLDLVRKLCQFHLQNPHRKI